MRKSSFRYRCRRIFVSLAVAGLLAGVTACASSTSETPIVTQAAVTQPGPARISPQDFPVDHIVVLVLENHTFDALYGTFPGANGLDAPGAVIAQTDENDADYVTLRLLCTYAGPGTQWCRAAAPDAIYEVPTGAVGVFKGRMLLDPPTVLHRSPPIAATGGQRLILVIDPIRSNDGM